MESCRHLPAGFWEAAFSMLTAPLWGKGLLMPKYLPYLILATIASSHCKQQEELCLSNLENVLLSILIIWRVFCCLEELMKLNSRTGGLVNITQLQSLPIAQHVQGLSFSPQNKTKQKFKQENNKGKQHDPQSHKLSFFSTVNIQDKLGCLN